MKPKLAAFTAPELFIILAIAALLIALLLPALGRAKAKSQRAKCLKHHKAIGYSFRVFAGDNGGKYPLETTVARANSYIVPTAASSVQVNATNAEAWQVAQALWNEIQSPRALLCPSDRTRHTSSRVTDFNGFAGVPQTATYPLTIASLGHPENRNNALSYTFGVAADESRPRGILTMDRNVNNVGLTGAIIATNLAPAHARMMLNHQATPTQAVWLSGTPIHGPEGNLGFADGSVQPATAETLRQALEIANATYGKAAASPGQRLITNQNEFLFP